MAKIRASSARLIDKTDALLTLIARLTQNRELDFTPSYSELKSLKEQIEQGSQDPELLDSVSSALNVLRGEVIKGLLKDKGLPKVEVVKTTGTKRSQRETITSIVGWEIYRPRIGRPYKVLLEDGGLYITSSITKILTGYFKTKNSVYEIKVLKQN